MIERRTKIVFFLILVCFLMSAYFLFDRMISGREEILHTPYTDKAFIALMEKLIAAGVFTQEEGKIRLDENALNAQGLSEKKIVRVKKYMPYLYVKDGKISFENQSVRVVNRAALMDETVIRGKFLDRQGVVLANSVFQQTGRTYTREYIDGPVYYPVIGHWNLVFGKRNLEKVMDDYLTGGLHLPVYSDSDSPFKRMKLGDDVILTIDSGTQKRAYELMKDKKGAVVVLDVETGEILTAVSTPSFDPNTQERSTWREAFKGSKERPCENRAFSTLYPPGSTFKTVVASAWLENEAGIDDYQVNCTGRKNKYGISDIHVHGQENLVDAYADSCNVFFSEIGVQLGHSLLDYSRKFGFNKEINLLPRIKDHSYASATSFAFLWENGIDGKEFSPIDFKRNPKLLAQVSIGQNLVSATPLQMAIVASTIANKGVMLNPYIIKEIRRGDGKKILFSAKPVEIQRAIDKKTAERIKDMMVFVMEKGTGKDVRKIYFEKGKYTTAPGNRKAKDMLVAGKTGTAEIGDKNVNGKIDPDEKPHSWFIGFAPADNPKVAIAVIAENQGFGSLTAAPIAVEVLAEALNK